MTADPLPPPLAAPQVTPPDRDFAALHQEALALVVRDSPGWTDHNPGDPGITLLETVLWSLADLHYRTQNRPLEVWSPETGLFRPAAERHWSGAPLPEDPERLAVLAAALADLPQDVVNRVRTAASRRDGELELTAAAPELDHDEIRAALRLLRTPLMLRAAYDESGDMELWDEEREALAVHRRRTDLARGLRAARRRIRETPDEQALRAEFGLTAEEARDAVGVHPAPPGRRPEDWEEPGGGTRMWPPHPLQVRTVEPVTLDDYARAAVGVADGTVRVRRAWAVDRVLPGVGWDGREVTEETARPGAVTLLVEPDDPDALTDRAARLRFLRQVLRRALAGPGETAEVDAPFELPRDDLDRQAPRRMIGHEVGAALLGHCPVTLRGVLYVPVTAGRSAVLDGALRRAAELLAAGRDPDAGGWRPGEPVRVAELVQAISRDPAVLGVDEFAASADGTAWHTGHLPIPADAVPVLGPRQCLTVRLEV